MKVRIKLFAVAKDLAGLDELLVDVPAGATIGQLRQAVGLQFPMLAKVLPHALWAIDAAYADDATELVDDSSVALIPPVSGG
jgi:molybdopterin converting factor small subunit